MKYVNLKDERIPVLGLGTAGIKGEDGKKSIKNALKIGYRLIDTAQMYKNEEEVGRAIEESHVKRNDLFLITKILRKNLNYEGVLASFKESLRKLRTDYVDLLLIHWPSRQIPLKETLDAMNQLKEEGRVKHLGVSNFTVDLMRRAQLSSQYLIAFNQVEYHPFLSQEDILTYCRNNDLILIAYSPLAQGKILKNEVLREISDKYEKTPAQVTLRWHIQQKNVLPIPKAANPQHQKENLEIFDFQLTEKEMQRITELKGDERLIDPESAPWH